MIPNPDPIPLPAPVWLFKVLDLLTIALHFAAVHLLVGGLFIAAIWAILARSRNDAALRDASGAITTRLPIVMTYVINLGVPPLLFLQVLYGQLVYTSSVLMGAWWISVIGLLLGSYSCLYVMTHFATKGRAFGWVGLITLLLVMKIGAIYSANMTLMLRPDAWIELYRNDPHGTTFPSGDPTLLPRFVYMMAASLTVAGAGMIALGLNSNLSVEAMGVLRRGGGAMAVVGALAQAGTGYWVLASQPEIVRSGLFAGTLYQVAMGLWALTAVGMLAVGGWAFVSHRASAMLAIAANLVGFLNIAGWTITRDGIRDIALSAHGFDVWNRVVVTNWSVVGIFLLLFVIGLGIVGALVYVTATAKGERESYA